MENINVSDHSSEVFELNHDDPFNLIFEKHISNMSRDQIS